MQQNTFGGRAPPGPDRSPDAHLDVIRAVDVAASRPWKKHPDSLSAVQVLYGDDEGKWMWKLDGMNGEGQGWMVAGNLVENFRCQRLHFEVKMQQKRLAPGLRPDPLE